MSLSNKQIALVHVACKKLGITDDDRHRIQKKVGGHQSLTKMSYKGWLELIRHLEACGFRAEGRKQMTEDRSKFQIPKSKLISKIYLLWYQLAGTYYIPGKEKAALRGFLRKRFRVDHENFLDTQKAIAVIEALKSISKRHNVLWD